MALRVAAGTEVVDQDVLLTDIKGLGRMLGRDERSLWRDRERREAPRPIKLGGLTKWRVAEIREWVEAGMSRPRSWEAMRKPLRREG